jgi:hypothetical protein
MALVDDLAKVALLAKASQQTLEGQKIAKEVYDFLFEKMLRGSELMGLTPIAEIPMGVPTKLYELYSVFLPVLIGLHKNYYELVHATVYDDGTVQGGVIPQPTITLNGSNPITLSINTAFTDPGATASDYTVLPPFYAGDEVSIEVSGDLDTSIPGTYILTYTATDAAGQTVSTTRTITIPALYITLNGDSSIQVAKDSSFEDPGATAIEYLAPNYEGTSVEVSISGAVDLSTLGTYELIYIATGSNNDVVTVSRIVEVI